MLKNIEGVHVGVLRQVLGMKEWRLGDETWNEEGPYRVMHVGGTKPLREYINKMQATVAEWVALRPIFEVCKKETRYEGEGKLREPWGGRGMQSNNWSPRWKTFWQQWGRVGNGNLTGVAGEMEESASGRNG